MTPLLLALSLLTADPVALVHNGAPGVWYPLQDARDNDECAEVRPLLVKQLRIAGERETLAVRELIDLRTALSDSRSQSAVLHAQLTRAVERGESAWRSPALWMAIGVVTALVGVLAVTR